MALMGMTNAERQRRYRDAAPPASLSGRSSARRTAGLGRGGGPTPSTNSAPCRPNTKLGATEMRESLADSRTAGLPEDVCDVKVAAFLGGFGRD